MSNIMGLKRGNKSRVIKVGHLMIHGVSDSLMKLISHLLRRVIMLDMSWSLPRRSGLPSKVASTPLGSASSGSSRLQVVEVDMLGLSFDVVDADSNGVANGVGLGSP
jgi:hypothetical protein